MNAPAAPLLSICIPTYNAELFVERCLESALQDPAPSKEIVIVDDGSTDRTVEIIRRWQKTHPECDVRLVAQTHLGVISARNKLVRSARGRFLVWLDSDDRLLEGGIQARLAYLTLHAAKMAVFGKYRVIDENDAPLPERSHPVFRNIPTARFATDNGLRSALVRNWCVPGPVLMVRKEIYTLLGAYDESISAHDYDFFLRMLSRNYVGYVDTIVSEYRIHKKNISRQIPHRIRLLSSYSSAIKKSIRFFPLTDRCVLRLVGTAANLKARLMGIFNYP